MLETVTRVQDRLVHVLLSAGSEYSLLSLLSAFLIASAWLVVRRMRRGRPLPLRLLLRALFPAWLTGSKSARADIKYFLLNTLVLGSLLGGAVLSSVVVAQGVTGLLNDSLGAQSSSGLPSWATSLIVTVALFLAFEFAYWLEHYLSHAVPVLWEFHKVHHSAEVLSPLTNARIHPVNALMFLNMVAVCVGIVRGVLDHVLGHAVEALTIAQTNVLFVAFTFLTSHLQHSHVWIAFTGLAGRVLLSPAHHQIHHSTDPRHFNKNFGSSIAVFDWLFGTLQVPPAKREKLRLGVDGQASDHNTLVGGLAGPFIAVSRLVMPWMRRSDRGGQPVGGTLTRSYPAE